MKKIIGFVLLFLAPFASVAAGPTCLPSKIGYTVINGSGSIAVITHTAAGSGVSYRCPDGTVVWYATLNSYQGPNAMSLLNEAMTYPGYTQAVAAMWAKYDKPGSGADWNDLVTKTKAAGAAIPKITTATVKP